MLATENNYERSLRNVLLRRRKKKSENSDTITKKKDLIFTVGTRNDALHQFVIKI